VEQRLGLADNFGALNLAHPCNGWEVERRVNVNGLTRQIRPSLRRTG